MEYNGGIFGHPVEYFPNVVDSYRNAIGAGNHSRYHNLTKGWTVRGLRIQLNPHFHGCDLT